MSYRSLYLTYRPQTFDEVAGQKPIVRTLQNALKTGKIAHSYLFAGPRGTGKTSMARLFAKALNCEEGIGHQCDHCSNCTAIVDGTHPDVIEIDAASNNGVEQVRDLIDRVKYAPIKGHYKVYIIDEVHMMTPGAFNALLKTLEEPPEDVVFILCTTEPHKVLPTIISRCQRYDFAKVGEADMKAKLISILGEEKAQYDEPAIDEVISLADGGMRDALSIMEQILAYSGNTLKEKDVLDLFGLASIDEKIGIFDCIGKGDVATLKKKCDSYVSGGVDIKRLTSDLIGMGKDGMIYGATKDATFIQSMNPEQLNRLMGTMSLSEMKRVTFALVSTQNDYRNVTDIRPLFELNLLALATKESEPEPAARPATAPRPGSAPAPKPAAPAPKVEEPKKEAPSKIPSFMLEEDEPFFDEKKPTTKKAEPQPVAPQKTQQKPDIPAVDISKIGTLNIAVSGEEIEWSDDEIYKVQLLSSKEERKELSDKKWGALNALKSDPKVGNLASLLAQGHPFALSKQVLILAFDFPHLAAKANIKKNQEAIQTLVAQILGRKVFVYSLSPDGRKRNIDNFVSNSQIGNIPPRDTIVVNLPKID